MRFGHNIVDPIQCLAALEIALGLFRGSHPAVHRLVCHAGWP